MLMGRFNRPRIMMDMFEHQGTKAAELAGEDYAAANRVSLPHVPSLTLATACHLHLEVPDQHAMQALGSKSSLWTQQGFVIRSRPWACMQGAGEAAYSQGMSGEGPTFQQHSRVPLDSQDGEDSGDLRMRRPACPMQAARQGSSYVCSCEMFWACCPPVWACNAVQRQRWTDALLGLQMLPLRMRISSALIMSWRTASAWHLTRETALIRMRCALHRHFIPSLFVCQRPCVWGLRRAPGRCHAIIQA